MEDARVCPRTEERQAEAYNLRTYPYHVNLQIMASKQSYDEYFLTKGSL